jgi:hypothetical protein
MPLVGTFKNERFEFSLRKTEIHCSTVDESAQVSLVQTYSNHSSETVESMYTFPLYRDATVVDFAIEFSDGKIICKLEEKDLAEETYKEAVSNGKKATLLTEKNAEEYDVLIGNISSNETVRVHLTYLVHLKRDLSSGGRQFILPTTLTPRYENRATGSSGTPSLTWEGPKVTSPQSLYNRVTVGDQIGLAFSGGSDGSAGSDGSPLESSKEDFENHEEERPADLHPLTEERNGITYSEIAQESPLHIKMDIVETRGLVDVILPRWNGLVIERKMTAHSCHLSLESLTLGEDFVLIIMDLASTESAKPFAIGEKNADGRSTVKMILPEKEIFKVDTLRKFEFVMIIDRSGSMEGEQMKNAKRALLLLMNSLPMDSYFNIYGFGSTWKRFYPKSIRYLKETFHESKRMIENIRADLGGTEMNGVLSAVYNTEKVPGYERRIILLTDGEITDMKSIYKIVDKDPLVPIFTIGVGNSVSHEFVRNLSERTGSSCEIVHDSDLIEKKVLQQLERTMYKKLSLTVDGNGETFPLSRGQDVLFYRTDTRSLTDSLTGELVSFVSFSTSDDLLHDGENIVSSGPGREGEEGEDEKDEEGWEKAGEEHFVPLKWRNEDLDGKQEKEEDLLQPLEPLKLSWVDKELRKMEKIFEREEDPEKKENVRKEIIHLSVKEKVLSPFTAFVGVLESSSVEKNADPSVKKVVSPLHPGKYAEMGKMRRNGKMERMGRMGSMGTMGNLDGYTSRMTGGTTLANSSSSYDPSLCLGGPSMSDAISNMFGAMPVPYRTRIGGSSMKRYSKARMCKEKCADEEDDGLGSVSFYGVEDDSWEDKEKMNSGKIDTLSFKDPFHIVAHHLQKAVAFDGSVSWEELCKEIKDVPEKPDDDVNNDLWATMLLMAYLTVHAGEESHAWKLTLDKSMKWVSGKCLSLDKWKKLYDKAIEAVNF